MAHIKRTKTTITSKYKVGDRVRVTRTWEGIVTMPGPVNLYLDGHPIFVSPTLDSSCTVEVLEPEYEVGAMYVDADGDIFCYQPTWESEDKPWYAPGNADGLHRSYVSTPLRKLVPEGDA